MRRTPPLLVAALVFAAHGAFAASAPPPIAGLTLTFVPVDTAMSSASGDHAVLDVGRVSAGSTRQRETGRRRGIVLHERVALRIDDAAGGNGGARLEAFLTDTSPDYSVRIDGILLSTVPRIIDPIHRLGMPVLHDVEVTIDPAAPEGALLRSIEWIAQTD